MKICHAFLGVSILFFLSSCVTVSYLGDSYDTTSEVKIYYDVNKINQEYEIMGQALGTGGGNFDLIKNKLVERAKKEGANAILISGLGSETSSVSNENQIKASFIKYI